MISQHSWTRTWLSICRSTWGHHSRNESQNCRIMSVFVRYRLSISVAHSLWTLITNNQTIIRRVRHSLLTNDSRATTSHFLQSRASLLEGQQRKWAPKSTIQQLLPTRSSWQPHSLHTTSTRRSKPTLISMSSSIVSSLQSSQSYSRRLLVLSSL